MGEKARPRIHADARRGDERRPTWGNRAAFKAAPTVLGIDKIMELLPHRFPFLLVDRVLEYVPGQYAVGMKNVTINDHFFNGHFPGRPIMPGVLQIEAMAQVGGIVFLDPETGGEGARDNFFFGGVEKCRFRRPVVPGDTLIMKVELTKLNKRFGIAKMHGEAYVGDQLACDADLTLVLGG